jgi:nicotinamidase-related amidase
MRRWSHAMAVVAVTATTAGAGSATEEKATPTGRTALVIIDIQGFYFEGGRVPLHEPLAAARQARRALEAFRRLGWPVAHVQHLPRGVAAPEPGIADAQYRFHAEVAPAPGEKLIGKHFANSFRGTDLEAWLRDQKVTRVVIAGMQTHMCVEAAARAASDLGFEVVVLHDACATRPLAFRGTDVSAAQVHAAALAAMSAGYARSASVDELLAELPAAGAATP